MITRRPFLGQLRVASHPPGPCVPKNSYLPVQNKTVEHQIVPQLTFHASGTAKFRHARSAPASSRRLVGRRVKTAARCDIRMSHLVRGRVPGSVAGCPPLIHSLWHKSLHIPQPLTRWASVKCGKGKELGEERMESSGSTLLLSSCRQWLTA